MFESSTIRSLKPNEIETLMDTSQCQESLALIIGLNTGITLDELLAIHKNDIDFSSGTILVKGIGNQKARNVYLTPSAMNQLSAITNRLNGSLDNLFQHSKYTFGKILNKWTEKVGFKVDWFMIQHTYSLFSAKAGVPIKLTAHNIGIKEDNKRLNLYYDLTPELIKEILRDKVIV